MSSWCAVLGELNIMRMGNSERLVIFCKYANLEFTKCYYKYFSIVFAIPLFSMFPFKASFSQYFICWSRREILWVDNITCYGLLGDFFWLTSFPVSNLIGSKISSKF